MSTKDIRTSLHAMKTFRDECGDVPFELYMLFLLVAEERRVPFTEIRRLLNDPPAGTMTRYTGHLGKVTWRTKTKADAQGLDLIEIELDQTDRRYRYAVLKPKGEELIRRMFP